MISFESHRSLQYSVNNLGTKFLPLVTQTSGGFLLNFLEVINICLLKLSIAVIAVESAVKYSFVSKGMQMRQKGQ